MITAPWRAARASAMADLPAAVGPPMTRTLSPAKPALALVPGQLHDRRSPVHIVRGQGGGAEGQEQCAHLAEGEDIARLDGRLACHRSGESLVARRAR